ncbi:PIN domain-containing protein [Micromonospora sp. NPDC023633]|uniref:PIN domain-containing protein n=1 Tax=Micromonospora sp. NPDC023633 TaxID=3154320 RepID=UPI0033DBA07D
MLITPLPGSDRKYLHTALVELHQRLVNLRGGSRSEARERAFAYVEWMHEARRRLYNHVRSAELDHLIPVRSYELLISVTATAPHPPKSGEERILNGLISTDQSERVDVFERALSDLEQQIERVTQSGKLVVLDTNVYLHHPQKLEEMDLAPVLGTRYDPIRIIVPMIVVDELDGLKQHSKTRNRWRAAYTTAVLDRVVSMPAGTGILRHSDFTRLVSEGFARGEVSVQVLLDPPGHVRLPIADEEIIDRALAVELLASRPVCLVTYDTGMAMRAKAAGLQVVKLEQELGDEPKAG